MMGILGIQRIIVITIMVIVNALLAAVLYLYVVPGNEKLERDLRGVRGQISQKQNQTADMREQFDLIQLQKLEYEKLADAGLFGEQSRVWALKGMDEFQRLSHVLHADYTIDSAMISEKPYLQETDFVVLDSAVSVEIDAMDDLDVYNFIYWIENAFPGHTAITELSINRVQDVDQTILRDIGQGEKRVMVRGELVFSWKTLSSKSKVLGDEQSETGGYR